MVTKILHFTYQFWFLFWRTGLWNRHIYHQRIQLGGIVCRWFEIITSINFLELSKFFIYYAVIEFKFIGGIYDRQQK